MSRINRLRKWLSPFRVPTQPIRNNPARKPFAFSLLALEDRFAPAVVTYDSGTKSLSFVSDAGDVDNVSITSPPLADTVQIVVTNDEITFPGDIPDGFTLSGDKTKLDIKPSTAAISQYSFNLGSTADDTSDVLTFGTLSIDGSLTATAETIRIDGPVKATGNVQITTVNSLASGVNDNQADIQGDVIDLKVTGAENRIGDSHKDTGQDFFKVQATTRLNASTNNGLIAISNVSGSLPLGTVDAVHTTIFLHTVNGAIFDANGDEINLIADNGANLTANGLDSSIGTMANPIETKIGSLTAEAKDGDISISDTRPEGMFIDKVQAKQRGNAATINENGRVVVYVPSPDNPSVLVPVVGSKNVNIMVEGDVPLLHVNATNAVTITSATGRILDINQDEANVLSRHVTLNAKGTDDDQSIGLEADSLELFSEQIDASTANGSVSLSLALPGTVNSIMAGGAGSNVSIDGSSKFLNVGNITAEGDRVAINLVGGALRGVPETRVTGQTVDLKGDAGIGTNEMPLVVSAEKLIATSKDSQAPIVIRVEGPNNLMSLDVTTNAGNVLVTYPVGQLSFAADTAQFGMTGSVVASFTNTGGDVVVAYANVHAITASGSITNVADSLLFGDVVTLTAGTGIGTASQPFRMQVNKLDASTSKGDIRINQIGSFEVSAKSSDFADPENGTGSDITIVVKSNSDFPVSDITIGTVSALGNVSITAGGAIRAGEGSPNNIVANTLLLSAQSGIGSNSAKILTSTTNLSANSGTSGGLYLDNNKLLTLESANAQGDISIFALGNLTVSEVNAGNFNVNLTSLGELTDGNGSSINIVANETTLNGLAIGQSTDPLETQTNSITASTSSGGIYLDNQSTSQLKLTATALGMGSDVDVDTASSLVLDTVIAQGDEVILEAKGSITDGNDTPDDQKVNVIARVLDIAAPGGIGEKTNSLEIKVDKLRKADGGTVGAYAVNAGFLLVTESSLEAAGLGTLTFVAESIAIEKIDDQIASVAEGRSIVLQTLTGAIVFLNPDDTIQTSNGGSITILAGTTDTSGGVAVLGNLKTDGGTILVEADLTVSIGRLDAGTGNVTVKSRHGYIVDGNGAELNVVAGSTTLSATGRTARENELDEVFKISAAAAAAALASSEQTATESLESSMNILKSESSRMDEVVRTNKAEKEKQDQVAKALQITVYALQGVALAASAVAVATEITTTVAEVVSAAAQAVPATGDGGAALIKVAFQIVATAASTASHAADMALFGVTIALDEVSDKATELGYTYQSSKDRYELLNKTIEAFSESFSITEGASKAAAFYRDTAALIRDQAIAARDQANVIGSPIAPLGLQVSGAVNVNAGLTNSYLQVVGPTNVDRIETEGHVTLISTGAIQDADGDGSPDILGEGLTIIAAGGIGTADNPLETGVRTLNASNAGSGDIVISNGDGEARAIDITGASNSGGGNIFISNHGNTAAGQGITISGPIRADGTGSMVTIRSGSPLAIAADITSTDAIVLEAAETAGPGDDLTVYPGVTIHSTDSSVTLRAGDNIKVPVGATIQANSAITITANVAAADSAGANVVVEGTLIAPSATIGVDPTTTNDDTFTVTPSATTPITVDGGDGTDVLNFNANGLPITIVGNTITAQGRAPVTFVNIESVNITNANGDGRLALFAEPGVVDRLVLTGTDQGAGTFTINDGIPFVFQGVNHFDYNSRDGDDVTFITPFATPVLPWNVDVTIDGDSGADRIIYNNVEGFFDSTSLTATAPWAGHIDSPGVTSSLNSQLVSFTNVVSVSMNANEGEDENLTVNFRDTSAPDAANLFFDTFPGVADLQLDGLFEVDIDTENFVGLSLNGRGGNDTFNVTPGPIPVFIDGGNPIGSTVGDSINFMFVEDFSIQPGPHNDQGGFLAFERQPVSWDHIEALSVASGVGTLIGTNGNDTINIVARDGTYDERADGSRDFTASLNDGPNILFIDVAAFRVDALAGNDVIELQAPAPNGAAWNMQEMTLFGNDGDDTIHANTTAASNSTITLDGGAGDDNIEGGMGNDILVGGNDNDTLIASPGDDTIDGGPGQNTFLIRGTISNDVIDVFQNAPTATANSGYVFAWTLNGVDSTSTIMQDASGSPLTAGTRPTVQSVRIDSGLGSDLIRIGVSDLYSDLDNTNGVPNQSLRFDVHGDGANVNNRLIVRDDGLGDLITQHIVTNTSGRVSVAPSVSRPNGGTGLGDVVYTGISRVDLAPLNSITGGTGTDGQGRVVVFHPDAFEANDTRLNSTPLSRLGQSSASPSIAPAGFATPFETNGDEDWYQFNPSSTNTFQIKILFERVLTLSNGRPGLPGGGDLSLDIYDANGNLITSGVADADGNNRTATFAASNDTAFPPFNRIFVRVKGAGDQPSLSLNRYDFANLSGPGNGDTGVVIVDANGPQVVGVNIANNPFTTADESAYNIYDPNKAMGPTPLIPSMEVHLVDSPARAPGYLYSALNSQLFEGSEGNKPAMGLFSVVGDRVGNVPIKDVLLTNNPVAAGQPATATVTIIFDTSSHTFAGGLPDDRYTLTILDGLTDPTNARLDGESTGTQPKTFQPIPSGNGLAGGDYVSRFTVDSRPEIGTFGNGSRKTFIDLNGNGNWDPLGSGDAVNHDNSFIFGQDTDTLFAGNFAAATATTANGYDKLGAYGRVGGQYRFLLDLDADGFADFTIVPTLQINGTPVAGDFSPNHPGQEIGVYSNGKWYLDSNGDNNLDRTDLVINDGMRGTPLVGDFDGDGTFDLAVFNSTSNTFSFDLQNNGFGSIDQTINFGFPSGNEIAVASDMNQDGVSDIGLFVPRSTNSSETLSSDWYFLVSLGNPSAGSVKTLSHPFNQTPFSNDLFFTFGDSFYQPIVGNFDPPIATNPFFPSPNPQMLLGSPQFASGSGDGEPATVTMFESDGTTTSTFDPFPGTTGGVRTSVADFNGDGTSDIAVGTGPNSTALVKIIDGKTNEVLFDIQPFDDFSGGVFVASGDINGDGIADLMISPDETGGPRVAVFTGGAFTQMANFFGIDDTNFRGGARTAAGDINGDGYADLVVSAGFGGGPRVSIYDGKALSRGEQVHPVPDFFMFESSLRNGVFVTVGDVNGDGHADIVGGAGPGGGPRVLIISGQTLLSSGSTAAIETPVANFFAGDLNQRNGVRVAAKNLDSDNYSDLVVGDGKGSGSKLTAYSGLNLTKGIFTEMFALDSLLDSSNGVFVG